MDVKKRSDTDTHRISIFCFIYRDDEQQIIESVKTTTTTTTTMCCVSKLEFLITISNFTLVWAAEFKEQSPRAI